MQSAARVPILLSFEVEAYPGPDRDPILLGDTLVARMSRNTIKQIEDGLEWPQPAQKLLKNQVTSQNLRRPSR